MGLTIYTYGGGEILKNVFNSIAILSGGGLFHSLMIIALSCGAFWAIVKIFFSSQVEAFFLRFFFPSLAITGLLMLPKTNVKIEDAYTNEPYVVSNVPWLIAFPSQLISTLGYKITDGIESVMHVPNDMLYNKTGMVFGSETALDMRKYRISNAVLEQNLKRFSKQCVFFDLALHKYTLNELKQSTDIWKFLGDNTSKVRMIPYIDPTDSKREMIYLSCINAVKEMTPIFDKEIKYHAGQDIVKYLPLSFQALTKIKKENEELVSQQLMMQFLDGELGSENLAKRRAYMQQKSTYHILGSIASSSLVTMRAVLEAIIYSSTIFVLPLAVLPGGLSFIMNWLWMLTWIQLWPPFYAIVNYILQIVAQGKAQTIFLGLSDSEKGLSFFTNAGLANLHEDMFAMCGYLATMVPFISYAIVKGGISSFTHLSSSLMNPGQSAASSAASELTSGNYSFANMSFGQMSYQNTTSLQHQMAPSLSSGHFTENSGDLTTTYSHDQIMYDQKLSKLAWDVSSDQSITEGLQKAQQSSTAFTETAQNSYMESLASQGRWMSDLSSHLSKSQSFNESISEREAHDIQESARYLQSQASSLSKQYGISEHDCMSAMLGGSFWGSGGSYGRNTSNDELANEAFNISKSHDFQHNLQKVTDFAKSRAHNALNDEGIRLSEGTSRSIDESITAQEQYLIAKNRSESISETASWAEQNSNLIRKSRTQDLVNWATEEMGAEEAKRVLIEGSDEEKAMLFSDFVSTLKSGSIEKGLDPDYLYESASIKTIDKEAEIGKLHDNYFDDARQNNLGKGDIFEKMRELESRFSMEDNDFSDHIKNASETVGNDDQKFKIEGNLESKIYERFLKGQCSRIKFSEQHTNDQFPLGWQK
jgi:conjugal transfer mating pair stabilization protein TraG